VLLILIPAAWLAVALLGLTLCRLAALSDDSDALALREWIASYLAEHRAASSDSAAEPRSFDEQRGAFGATG
jgi:hypothetical protein